MLKLKRVELQGFKSFCERTEMRFHGEGVAAIVGPNGCGKSNLSDAISWVLGEQSAKSLRGTNMLDVIFAGTRERKPLGMAQVSLQMQDPEGGKDGKAADVTVTRRLYRSGESEYLIDGKSARLRDIQDIFTGTGLGPESYAIIEQGRIGQLLSSKPADRRSVIEEAAGISKFKTKRRLAEARLESAKQNLSRVFDILEEVGRQANSLKRQAAKAKRYEELRGELTVALKSALTGKFTLLEREAAKVALELNDANSLFQELSSRVVEQESTQQQQQQIAYSTEAELTAARKKLNDLHLESERVRGRMESLKVQSTAIDQRSEQNQAESAGLAERLTTIESEVAAHQVALADFEQNAAEARSRLESKSEERSEAQRATAEHQTVIEATQRTVVRLLGEASQLQNRLAQMEAHAAALDRDRNRLTKEDQMATADLERLEARKIEIENQLASRQMQLETAAEQRKRIEETLGEHKGRLTATRQQLETIRAEASRIKARKDSLEEILSHRAYTTESVKNFFTAFEQRQDEGWKPIGVLADYVEVDTAYEKAAEEFLHDELEYILVHDRQQAESGIDLVRSDLDGRVTFLVHPEHETASEATVPALGPEAGVAGKLTDVLRLTNGLTGAPAVLLPRLSRCYLAHDRSSAQQLAAQHPDLYFLTPDGVCYQGYAVSGGRKTGSGPLALKRELRELIGLSQQKANASEQMAANVEMLETELGQLTEELEQVRVVQQSHEREALALDHELRKLGEEFARSNSRLSVARLELDRISKEETRLTGEREGQAGLLAEREQTRMAEEAALAVAREVIAGLQGRFAQLSDEHSSLRAELAGREERARAELAAKTRIENQRMEIMRRRDILAAEVERFSAERQRLFGENETLITQSAALAQTVGEAEIETARLAEAEAGLRASLAMITEELKTLRGQTQAAQERRSQVEVALVERRAEIRFLDETAHKELNASLAELMQGKEEAGEPARADEFTLDDAEEKVRQLRSKIENLGAVNPEALVEYEEAQRRYDFLNTQRQDLLDSVRDTEKAIHDIDIESRKRFGEAFHIINENFKHTFTKLFGGGSAEMRLTDESNLNDSGIDIIASPPGKRLQNVLLLSGGEKALTAISLLMAIFQYTPSPFCILDEVDAPLDEPNIQRLTGLIKEMSDRTQFIVITHAKRTMESAQALYGVTMQEPGVSRLVAVRFHQADTPIGGAQAKNAPPKAEAAMAAV